MAAVHPAFDPLTRTWFAKWPGKTRELTAEAKSLRELARLLPPGTEILGYYPGGTTWCPPEKKEKSEPTPPSPPDPPPPPPEPPEPRAAPRPRQRVRSNPPSSPRNIRIVKLFDKGSSYDEIAKELGVSRSTVAGVIHRAKGGSS